MYPLFPAYNLTCRSSGWAQNWMVVSCINCRSRRRKWWKMNYTQYDPNSYNWDTSMSNMNYFQLGELYNHVKGKNNENNWLVSLRNPTSLAFQVQEIQSRWHSLIVDGYLQHLSMTHSLSMTFYNGLSCDHCCPSMNLAKEKK